MLKKLVTLAFNLDAKGLHREADIAVSAAGSISERLEQIDKLKQVPKEEPPKNIQELYVEFRNTISMVPGLVKKLKEATNLTDKERLDAESHFHETSIEDIKSKKFSEAEKLLMQRGTYKEVFEKLRQILASLPEADDVVNVFLKKYNEQLKELFSYAYGQILKNKASVNYKMIVTAKKESAKKSIIYLFANLSHELEKNKLVKEKQLVDKLSEAI
jgi:hypothetical protein